ncbi:MAG: hypothetical protein IJ740_18600 [Ruminococcus sp.]|nr:hypothetical protein [Ruminococcus sp.]
MKPISSIKTALNIYLNHTCLQTKQVQELFGVSRTQATKYLAAVRTEQIKAGIPIFVSNSVDTTFAYKQWGIDVKVLERRYKSAQALGLTGEVTT